MRDPITSKEQMYKLLAAGLLGNTVRQHFSIDEWEASEEATLYPFWGVRTLTPGGPCRLYTPREEVRSTALRPEFRAAGVNISLMVDSVRRVTLMADVFMGDCGLEVYGVVDPPPGANWRRDMPVLGRRYQFLQARAILLQRLTPCDLEDLNELLGMYPAHVIELSACDRPIGIYPHRKGVVWEVRIMSGEYERSTWKQHTVDHLIGRPRRGWSREGD
jgi:hypothetical protein